MTISLLLLNPHMSTPHVRQVTERWPCDKPEEYFAFGMFYWIS